MIGLKVDIQIKKKKRGVRGAEKNNNCTVENSLETDSSRQKRLDMN